MKEILEKEMTRKDMPLHDHEKVMLRKGLESNRMKQACEIVIKALYKREE